MRLLFELFNIGAGYKRTARANHDDGRYGRIVRCPADVLLDPLGNSWTECVHWWVIDRDDGDAIDCAQLDQFTHVSTRTRTVTRLDATGAEKYRRLAMTNKVLDFDNLIAIDTHVHLHAESSGNAADEAARKYFGYTDATLDPKAIAEYYRSRRIGCVVFSVDERITGRPQVSNEDVIALAAENADIMIAFSSVDPTRGAEGVAMARRQIASGTRGFKLHPPLQQFRPNDRAIYPFYEVVAEARLPVIFHTGHSGIGTGMPGGGGVRLKYGNPMDIDDVAVDFPDMPIIMAHPSFPWQDEAISVCLHKRQVFIDLSGWSPKYFSPSLIQYANTLLREKMLFGSDFPFITPERWLADFEKIPIRDDVRPLILKENAKRLFGAPPSKS